MGWKFYSADGSLLTKVPSAATATEATNVTVTANDSEDADIFPVFVDGASGTQGIETDSGFTYNPSSGMLVIAGELDAGSLDISGNADIDGTMEADAITVDGTTLAEYITDTVGGMVTGNTETGITVTFEDGDNTLDFEVGTLNQDTTGTAAIATTSTIVAKNTADETVYPVFVDTATGNIGLETDTGFTYNPSTGALTATSFTGSVTGAVTGSATQVTVTAVTDNDTVYPVFVTGSSGANDPEVATALTYNPSTGLLSAAGLTLSGNLTVNGTTTTIDTATLAVEDPLLALATGNNAADAIDIGFYGLYDTSGSQDLYTGLFRDANDSGKWKLFVGNQAAPTTTVDTSGTGYAVGTLVANIEGDVTGDVAGNAATVTVVDTTDTSAYVALFDSATGSLAAKTDAGITYNAGTGMLTATGFTGPLTGNASGTAATVTGGTQASITNVANVVEVGALNAGSITSGFGTIDIGSSTLGSGNITSTGSVTGTSLDVNGAADISGVLTMSGGKIDMSSEAIDNIKSATFIAEVDNGDSGTSKTIDWGAGQKQKVTMTGNCTFTFTAPLGPCNLVLKLIQDGTGSHTAAWTGGSTNVDFPAGTVPTLTAAGSSVDIISFYYDGTNANGTYYGQAGLAFA